jgi:hypothetical protein
MEKSGARPGMYFTTTLPLLLMALMLLAVAVRATASESDISRWPTPPKRLAVDWRYRYSRPSTG